MSGAERAAMAISPSGGKNMCLREVPMAVTAAGEEMSFLSWMKGSTPWWISAIPANTGRRMVSLETRETAMEKTDRILS